MCLALSCSCVCVWVFGVSCVPSQRPRSAGPYPPTESSFGRSDPLLFSASGPQAHLVAVVLLPLPTFILFSQPFVTVGQVNRPREVGHFIEAVSIVSRKQPAKPPRGGVWARKTNRRHPGRLLWGTPHSRRWPARMRRSPSPGAVRRRFRSSSTTIRVEYGGPKVGTSSYEPRPRQPQ